MTSKKTAKITKTTLTPLGRFDKLTASIRVTLYLYKNPKSGMTAIIKNAGVDQGAAYAVKDWLEENNFLLMGKKDSLPYSPVLSLNDKGKKIAECLLELEKLLSTP
jgi:DNA-binding MarR family transcriptional regulator